MRGVVTTMIQTEQYGTPLASALRVLSAEFRNERMMRAEEKAARLPAIMTVPLILFILPVLFIVILGPAACSINDALLIRTDARSGGTIAPPRAVDPANDRRRTAHDAFTPDQWLILLLVFLLGLVLGMALLAGPKWKGRYREEVARDARRAPARAGESAAAATAAEAPRDGLARARRARAKATTAAPPRRRARAALAKPL